MLMPVPVTRERSAVTVPELFKLPTEMPVETTVPNSSVPGPATVMAEPTPNGDVFPLDAISVPPFTVVGPVYELVWLKVRVPVERVNPPPDTLVMWPPKVRPLPLATVKIPDPREIDPVPAMLLTVLLNPLRLSVPLTV